MNRKRRRHQLDFAIDRLDRVVNEQLLILNDHQLKLDKLRSTNNFHDVHSEQLKAQNCVKRLQNLLRELDNLKQSVVEEDVEYLNEKAKQFVVKINIQIEHILKVQHLFCDPETTGPEDSSVNDNATNSSIENLELEESISERKNMFQSVQNLRRDLIDLHASFHKLASLIWNQKETTDRIDSNITLASDQVHHGAVELTSIKKAVGLPLLGAAIGSFVAGPIGLVAGYKIAALAGLGAASVGYSTGKVVQRFANPPAITMGDSREEEQSDRISATV